MRIPISRRAAALLLVLLPGCAARGGAPGGPAPIPEVIGPETVSAGNVFRGALTPDGDTLYFFKNVTPGQEDYRIFRAHRARNGWSAPARVTLGGDFSDLYPAIAPDGRRMVFSSYRPAPGDTSAHPSAYLWYVERSDSTGPWGEPVFMADANEWAHYHAQPTFTASGALYFNRSGWDYEGHSEHLTRWDGRRFGPPDTSAAWLALSRRTKPGQHLYETTPGYDGTYQLLMIGAREGDGSRAGAPDIHVARRTPTGWSDPTPLAGGVNTTGTENFPFYGREGRDLLFVRDFERILRVPLDRAIGTPGSRVYRVDTVATGLNAPWSLAFLPGGDMLVSEKYGGIRRVRAGALSRPLEGTPAALQSEDSGLLDLAVDPRFAENRFVYLAFTEGSAEANHTALFRARLDGDRLVDGRVIYRAGPDKRAPNHPGGRLAFLPDETLLLTIGDGYDYRGQARELGSALGKVVRLDRDGRPARDNPFTGRADARPEL
ncbi:MAG TPA: PQQ-dependent sugar dehydrogenase, partial [Gemmatimonadales bacterium]|nr:PQQ-dependent sugar dehydrogenase [Gemmatimonadales bacterium]